MQPCIFSIVNNLVSANNLVSSVSGYGLLQNFLKNENLRYECILEGLS